MPGPDPKRDFLRHSLATLAYRGGKAVRKAAVGFAAFQGAGRSRVGQIAMLRRLAGAPVSGENYFVDMAVGRVSPEQAAGRKEF